MGFKAAVGDLGSRTFATAREIKSTELLHGMFEVVSDVRRTNDRERGTVRGVKI